MAKIEVLKASRGSSFTDFDKLIVGTLNLEDAKIAVFLLLGSIPGVANPLEFYSQIMDSESEDNVVGTAFPSEPSLRDTGLVPRVRIVQPLQDSAYFTLVRSSAVSRAHLGMIDQLRQLQFHETNFEVELVASNEVYQEILLQLFSPAELKEKLDSAGLTEHYTAGRLIKLTKAIEIYDDVAKRNLPVNLLVTFKRGAPAISDDGLNFGDFESFKIAIFIDPAVQTFSLEAIPPTQKAVFTFFAHILGISVDEIKTVYERTTRNVTRNAPPPQRDELDHP